MNLVKRLVVWVTKQEPAISLGALASAALVAQDAVVNGHVHDWRAAVPVIAGALIRQYVVPAEKAVVPFVATITTGSTLNGVVTNIPPSNPSAASGTVNPTAPSNGTPGTTA